MGLDAMRIIVVGGATLAGLCYGYANRDKDDPESMEWVSGGVVGFFIGIMPFAIIGLFAY